MVVAEKALEGRQADALLHGGDSEGVAEDVGTGGAGQAGALGHPLHEALDRPRGHLEAVVEREIGLEEDSDAGGQGNHPRLTLGAVGTALAVKEAEAGGLPVEVLGGEAGELGDPEAGVEEGEDHELLVGRRAGVGEAGGLVGREGLAFVLVPRREGHGLGGAPVVANVIEELGVALVLGEPGGILGGLFV